jgi:hypothetical protein
MMEKCQLGVMTSLVLQNYNLLVENQGSNERI